jgi:hypothetical protein
MNPAGALSVAEAAGQRSRKSSSILSTLYAQVTSFSGFWSNNGEHMDDCEVPHAPDNRWTVDSYLEMEFKLESLRSLVCDLLRTNQELRIALDANASLFPIQGLYRSRQTQVSPSNGKVN